MAMNTLNFIFFEENENIARQDDAALDFLKKRVLGAVVVIMMFFALILSRLWFLQIYHGPEYEKKAESNRVRTRQIAAPRGHILDRKGRSIVTNRPSFNVVLIRENSRELDHILKRLASVLKVDVSELWKRIREQENQPLHFPIRLMEDIDWQTLAYLENHNQEFSGVRIETVPVRVYEYGDLAANSIGYIGKISKKELENAQSDYYSGNDLIGKTGLERLREKDLRGEKGWRRSEVNARGFEQKLLKQEDALPGNEMILNLDLDLQKTAEEAMEKEGKSGAVVVIEVNSGRLLTLATTPQIHLEDFIGGISKANWKKLSDNPQKPLRHKAIQGAYPPGSVFKMVTALAGLSKGVIDENTLIYCPGHFFYGGRTYRCWKKSGHGPMNLKQAIAQSCDVFFYQVGMRVGVDGIAEISKQLGLGKRTGIELEHENRGLVPSKKWKRKRYKTKWHNGETLSVAIGQGFNLVTPLQIAVMTSAIANGGTLYRPMLVDIVTDPDGRIIDQTEPEEVGHLEVSPAYLKLVQGGMLEAVQGAAGTARRLRIPGIPIAGKTGTAQVVKLSKSKGLKDHEIPYKERDHAWFTCYAPADKPEIAVTVLVEHGMHGSSGAGPIAKIMLEKYFAERIEARRAREKQAQVTKNR